MSIVSYQRDFITFALETGVLSFGEFTLKSGRLSPYFFNSGGFSGGSSLARLGRFYAEAIVASGVEFDVLYGPAYKGIPLVAAVAIAFAEHHGRDVPFCFNRKEVKDHGEGGLLVGAKPSGRVLVVDDVISAGTSVRESIAVLEPTDARAVAVAIALDRMERGQGERSAIEEVEDQLGLEVVNIVDLDALVAYLAEDPDRAPDLERVRAYRARYGTK